jgi:outer membrane protein assembly factor BamB
MTLLWTMDRSEWGKERVADTSGRRGFIKGLFKTGAGSALSINGVDPVLAEENNLVWKFQTDDQVWSTPAVVDGTVYVGSLDTNLYALDRDSGDEQWRFQTNGAVWSPVVADDTVYFCTGSDTEEYEYGYLYAVDVNSGEERWRFQTSDPIYSPPVIEDGTVYVGGSDGLGGILYAVDINSGQQQWSLTFDGSVNTCSAVVDGMIYIGTQNERLYAINATSNELEWDFETEAGGTIHSTPAVTGNTIYFGSQNGNLYALNVDSGKELWQFKTNEPIDTLPTVADETVCFGNWDNNLYALDANSGDKKWHFETESSIRVSPAVADDRVYFMSDDLHVVDVDSGEEQWHFETGNPVGEVSEFIDVSQRDWEESSPIVVDNNIYFGSKDSHIYALDTEVGSETDWLGALIIVGLLGIYIFAQRLLTDNGSVENEESTDRDQNETSDSEFSDSVLKFVKNQGWSLNVTELRDGTDIIAGKRKTDTGPKKMLLMIVCNPEDEVTSDHLEYLLKSGKKKDANKAMLTSTVAISDEARELCEKYSVEILDPTKVQSYSESDDFAVGTDEISIPNSGSDSQVNTNDRTHIAEDDSQGGDVKNGEKYGSSFTVGHVIGHILGLFVGLYVRFAIGYAVITIPILIISNILGLIQIGISTWISTILVVPTILAVIFVAYDLITDGLPTPDED